MPKGKLSQPSFGNFEAMAKDNGDDDPTIIDSA